MKYSDQQRVQKIYEYASKHTIFLTNTKQNMMIFRGQ